MYGQGISHEGELVDLGLSLGILERSGAWYSFKGEKIAQGRENAKNFLLKNKEIAKEIKAKILQLHGIKG